MPYFAIWINHSHHHIDHEAFMLCHSNFVRSFSGRIPSARIRLFDKIERFWWQQPSLFCFAASSTRDLAWKILRKGAAPKTFDEPNRRCKYACARQLPATSAHFSIGSTVYGFFMLRHNQTDSISFPFCTALPSIDGVRIYWWSSHLLIEFTCQHLLNERQIGSQIGSIYI